ncbi:hypothetical protein [Streptomyces sp. NPDC048606]|uniref:hypothetical protein n=1 Tax=Streptomyces sp. NPDC048606 TaxID=3154726 RepID=UPI003436AF46
MPEISAMSPADSPFCDSWWAQAAAAVEGTRAGRPALRSAVRRARARRAAAVHSCLRQP